MPTSICTCVVFVNSCKCRTISLHLHSSTRSSMTHHDFTITYNKSIGNRHRPTVNFALAALLYGFGCNFATSLHARHIIFHGISFIEKKILIPMPLKRKQMIKNCCGFEWYELRQIFQKSCQSNQLFSLG